MSERNWTEDELKRGLIASDHEALIYFYKNYAPMIRNFVLINSGRTEDSEDLFQECLIELIEKLNLKNLILNCSIKTYFYSMCRNQWLTRLKRNSKSVSLSDTYDEFVETDDAFEQKEMITERQKVLADLIRRLGESCQKIITLFYYEELSMNLIAERLGYTNAANAKNQKYKCLQKLKELAQGDTRIKDIL